jgi:hypothetical protein
METHTVSAISMLDYQTILLFLTSGVTSIQGVTFKMQPHNNCYSTKTKSKAGPPHVILSLNLPKTLESSSPWLLGCFSCQLRKSCADLNMVYSQTEHVFILEHYFTSKLLAVVHEASSNIYPDNNTLTGNKILSE